jgi:hypothetical protein
MASTTVTVLTPTLTGASVTTKTGVASSETVTIAATTAQGALDFRTLKIRVENTSSTASVSLSLAASTVYTDGGIGAATITIATAATVVIGGQSFEGSRFLNSSDTIVFTQTGAGPTSWQAFQAPRATE